MTTIANVTNMRGLAAIHTCVAQNDFREHLGWLHLDTVTGIVTGTDGVRAAQAQVLLPCEDGTQFLWKPGRKLPARRSTKEIPMLVARGEEILELQLADKTIGYGERSTDSSLMNSWRSVLKTLAGIFDGEKYEMVGERKSPQFVSVDLSFIVPASIALGAKGSILLPTPIPSDNPNQRESFGPIRIGFHDRRNLMDFKFIVMPYMAGDAGKEFLSGLG